MGPFSQNCLYCDHPLLSPLMTDEMNAWMSDAVSVTPDGSLHTGVYDGYGRLEPDRETAAGGAGTDAPVVGPEAASTVYHLACWEMEGRPTDYRGPSPEAPDQGWSFVQGAHSLPDPRLQVPDPPRFGMVDPAAPDLPLDDGPTL